MHKKFKSLFIASTIGIGLTVPIIPNLIDQYSDNSKILTFENSTKNASSTNAGYANMYTLKYAQVKDMALTNINWFGSHDSGAYGIFNRGLGVDGKQSDFINFAQNIGMGTHVAKLGQMQTESVLNQLEDGVRYLDLRLSNSGSSYKSVNDIYITHSSLYASFVDIVNQIDTFVKRNPNEIVFIDINHWYPTDKNNGRMQKIVLEYLINVFGNRIAKNSEYELTDPYGKFINPKNPSQNKNIILFFSGLKLSDNHVFNSTNTDKLATCQYDASRGNSLISYWTGQNVYHTDQVIKKLDEFLEIKKKYPNNLYVVQAIPNWDDFQIFSGLMTGATGYSMDSWWNIGKDVSTYFTNTWYTINPKYTGVILMVNDIVSKVSDITYKINWSISNMYRVIRL